MTESLPVDNEMVYESSLTKSHRRTKAEIQVIRDAMYSVLLEEQPATVRQVFYQLVSRGVIAKTESEYKNTVCRLLGQMRLDAQIPFGWIADNTRWMRKPTSYDDLEDALWNTARTYRRSLWADADSYVEIWLEKEALAGVLFQETAIWDVPLMVTRGYPSLSYLYEAADVIQHQGRPVYLYYFGDNDPSGLDIARVVEEGITKFAHSAEVYFERVAVTQQQIADWNLPLRPTKQADSRAKGFSGDSVEADAIPPQTLRRLVRESIEFHIDEDAIKKTRQIEHEERETFRRFLQSGFAPR